MRGAARALGWALGMSALSLSANAQEVDVVGTVHGQDVTADSKALELAEGYAGVPCRIVRSKIREALVQHVLVREGLVPSEEEVTQTLERHLPGREALERHLREAQRQQTALREALLRSEVDPTRDREIWQQLAAEFMTYEGWVRYRTRMKGQPEPTPLPARMSREDWLKATHGLRSMVFEEVFQRWVTGTWARENGLGAGSNGGTEGEGLLSAPWDEEWQLRFWTMELARTPVTIAGRFRCDQLKAADLISRQISWPDAKE